MPDETQTLEILKKAIQVERDGYLFYKTAAEKTVDAKGKEMFESLASDEVKHMNALREQYKNFKEEGKFEFEEEDLEKEFKIDFNSKSPIFSEQIKAKIKERHFEMTALSIGIMLETNSIDFYKKSAEQTEDPQAKALYLYLADWEGQHLRALIAQQNYLKEEYWTEARFYPDI